MIFGPKPPPMKGAITRTCFSERPSMAASPLRMKTGAWVVSQIVICWLRASQSATTPRFSMAAAVPRS
jgi:hypothetical protein